MDIVKGVVVAVIGYILLKSHEAQQRGEVFQLSSLPIIGAIMNPQMDPLPTSDGSVRIGDGSFISATGELTMAEALSAIDANPNLVADLTPQGQFRVDTRATM